MALVITFLLIWQQDNVSNQREHIVLLLANEQTRLSIPEEPEPVGFISCYTFNRSYIWIWMHLMILLSHVVKPYISKKFNSLPLWLF